MPAQGLGLEADMSEKSGQSWVEGQQETMLDVIVPVYRDLALTRACLESVIASGGAFELVVVDDATPEPELAAWLDDLAAQGLITLLRNESNQGFVKAVNRAMALHPTRDAILLNADTRVHGDWIARLKRAAYSQDRIATVTPFANNAEITSHPYPCQSNPMPASLASMDDAFAAANAGKTIELPTAVGFCVYIRRAAWQQAGPFDEAAFGHGYGEENDFCLRATALGWQHLLACDVFVYHRGGASFGQETSIRRQAAMHILRKRYPHYEPMVHRFIRKDPPGPYRAAADLTRLATSGRPKVLFISHDRGGGTWRHMRDLAELFMEELDILTLRPAPGGFLALAWLRPGERLELRYKARTQWDDLVATLQHLPVQRVHVHHLVDLPEQVAGLAQILDVPMDITIHDYFAICPRITLTGTTDRYCGEPDEAGCNRCLRQWPRPTRMTIETWRSVQHGILAQAQRLFVPSRDALRRLQRHFPDLAFVYAPHPQAIEASSVMSPMVISPPEKKGLRVVVVGVLSRLKGAALVDEVAELAARQGLPVTVHILGPVHQGFSRLARQVIVQHGAYEEKDLPMLLQEARAHVAWFPTRWPETWSYTLSACLRAALPVVAPDFGAFAERLADRPGQLVPEDAPATQWLQALEAWSATNPSSKPLAVRRHDEAGLGLDYAKCYGDPVRGATMPQPDWNQLRALTLALCQTKGREGRYGVRLIVILAWLRSRPQLAFLASRIPGSWQTMVKRLLLGHVKSV